MTPDIRADGAGTGTSAELTFDGASSGNPGPSGYGFVLDLGDDTIEGAEHIGRATNNEAEYRGLVAGLEAAAAHEVSELGVLGDAEVVIRQMTGQYDVNAENLEPLHGRAQELADEFDTVGFAHVGREKNSRANELATKARDDTDSQ